MRRDRSSFRLLLVDKLRNVGKSYTVQSLGGARTDVDEVDASHASRSIGVLEDQEA